MDRSASAITDIKWNRTLAVSILPIIVGLSLLVSIISGIAVNRLAKKNLQTESRLQAELADAWLASAKAKIDVYRNYVENRCASDEDILDIISLSNLAHDDFPGGVYVGTSENVLLDPSFFRPDTDYQVTQRPWYSIALKENGYAISEPYTDMMLEQLCITISARLKNLSRGPVSDVHRVIAADIYLTHLQDLTRGMMNKDYISGGIFITKDSATVIANTYGDTVGKPLFTDNLEKHLDDLEKYCDGTPVTDTLDGITYYVTVTSLKEAPWYLISYISADVVHQDLWVILISIVVISAVTVLVLFFLLKYYAKKMNLVQSQAHRLSDKLEVQSTFVSLIRLLTETEDFDESVNRCLQIIAEFYKADRAYIFSLNYEKKVQNNTYEWCAEGVIPEKENLQNISMNITQRWWPLFERQGCVQISDLQGELSPGSAEYEILSEQRINSLLIMPFIHDGVITGYIGVDNPKANITDKFLLESAATCVSESLMKQQYLDILYDRSYKDILTGSKNRRAYFEDLSKLSAQKELQVGVVFADLNGLKDTNDTKGHEAGDKLIIEVMHFLDHCFDCYRHTVYRIGGDEFVVFVHDIEERTFNRIIGKTLEILEEMPIVSIGDSWIGSGEMAERQVAEADTLMYIRKKDYYRAKGHDRRRRREEISGETELETEENE